MDTRLVPERVTSRGVMKQNTKNTGALVGRDRATCSCNAYILLR
jgi:hypothetical protein